MIWLRLFFISQFLLNSLVIQSSPRRAPNNVSGSQIVAAVNALRAGYGLPPYQLDGNLAQIGQTQSNYMASIKTLTHTRPDGSGPAVSSENIAVGGPGESADAIVRKWTFDAPHTITLIGFKSGLAGAGAALASDGMIYYTLDVTNTGKSLTGLSINSLPAAAAASNSSAPGTPIPTQPLIPPLLTVTPQANGSIIHTVQYGQTLSTIAGAYNLALKDLLALNPMVTASTVIQIGQRLLIRPPTPPTLQPLPGATALPPTASPPHSPVASFTLTPTSAILIAPTEAAGPSGRFNYSLTQWIGITIAFLGLAMAFFGRFFLKRRPPK